MAARYFSCSCLTSKIASIVPLPGTKPNWESSIDTNCLIEAFHNPLQDFRNLLCQLQTAVVAPFQCVPFSFVEADNETLLPVRGYLAIMNDCNCEVTDHGGAHVTGGSYHLHHYAWWARCFASLHLWDSLLNHINGDWDGRAFHWWLIWQVVWVPVKINVEKPLVVPWPQGQAPGWEWH